MVEEFNPMIVWLSTVVTTAANEEMTMMEGSRMRTMTVTTSLALTLVATRESTVSYAMVSMLKGVFRRSLLSGVYGRIRTDASHFSHINFFQSEH